MIHTPAHRQKLMGKTWGTRQKGCAIPLGGEMLTTVTDWCSISEIVFKNSLPVEMNSYM